MLGGAEADIWRFESCAGGLACAFVVVVDKRQSKLDSGLSMARELA